MDVRRIGVVLGLATMLGAGFTSAAAAAEPDRAVQSAADNDDPDNAGNEFTECRFVGTLVCDTAGAIGGGKLGTGIKDACEWVVVRECDRKPPFEDPPVSGEDAKPAEGEGEDIPTEEPPPSKPTKVGPGSGVEWEQSVPASCELQVAVLCGQVTSLFGEFGKPLKKYCKRIQKLCRNPIKTRPIVVAPGVDDCPAGTHEVGDGCVRDEPAEQPKEPEQPTEPPAAEPGDTSDKSAATTCPPGYHRSAPGDMYDWCWPDDGSNAWVNPVPTS